VFIENLCVSVTLKNIFICVHLWLRIFICVHLWLKSWIKNARAVSTTPTAK